MTLEVVEYMCELFKIPVHFLLVGKRIAVDSKVSYIEVLVFHPPEPDLLGIIDGVKLRPVNLAFIKEVFGYFPPYLVP